MHKMFVTSSVVKGSHVYKIRPPNVKEPLLRVDREYGNIHDKDACLVWLPELECYPKPLHDTVLRLSDIASLSIGHVPRGLGSCFCDIIDMNSVNTILCEVTGNPKPSFPPWPAPNESGGGVVISCTYIVKSHDAVQIESMIKTAVEKMEEHSVMTISIHN